MRLMNLDLDLSASPLQYIQGEVHGLSVARFKKKKDRFQTYQCAFRLVDVPAVHFDYESKWNPKFEEGQSVTLAGRLEKLEGTGHAKFHCVAYKDIKSGRIRSKAFRTPMVYGVLPIALVLISCLGIFLNPGADYVDAIAFLCIAGAIASCVGAAFFYHSIRILRARKMLSGFGVFPRRFDIELDGEEDDAENVRNYLGDLEGDGETG